MVFIEITRATFLNGLPAEPGEVYEVDPQTAKATVAANKGKIVDRPAGEPAPEPPKPKVKKVSATPKADA